MAEKTEVKSTTFKGISIVLAILVLIALAAAGYFYVQYRNAQQILKNPNIQAQQDAQTLVTEVGKLIELPKNEVPTIATVSDASKLKDQPFFANSQNGDKVLIYTAARKAILYRPKENKIIDVGPVNIAQPSPSVSPVPSKVMRATTTPVPTGTTQVTPVQ